MGLKIETPSVIGASLILTACVSPFSQPLTYKAKPIDAAGSITLSDPKLYTREMLINERGDEVNWINQLLKDSQDSTKVKFTADLLRETEQISSFAASLGLKFDPAAALNYRRAKETGDVQQQIDMVKLQIQLEQLKRDADLMAASRADQTSPVNADLGKVGTATVGQASSFVTAPSTADMKTSIAAMITALQGRLDKAGVLPAEANISVNPIDDFRDRTAYRDLLKSARNAAALDESHDANAARLLRLNFQAMVQPDHALPRSLGAVQIRVLKPDGTGPSQSFFDQWLDYENLEPSNRDGAGAFPANGEIAALRETGFFEVNNDYGVQILLPRLQDNTDQGFSIAQLDKESKWADDALWKDDQSYQNAAIILSDPKRLDGMRPVLCSNAPAPSAALQNDATDIKYYGQVATYRIQAFRYRNNARSLAVRLGRTPPLMDAQMIARYDRARTYLQTLRDILGGQPSCGRYLAAQSEPFKWSLITRGGYGLSGNDVHVYDVGPREQVERVSTVARTANSLSLAASLAASDPGSGAAVDAAAGYSRQAMGRASAMERVPAVVGYALAGKQTFGWVLGPRATIDARGKIKMRQVLKSYDLFVDLSVPNWWGALDLEVQTVWAPSPGKLVNGVLKPVAAKDPVGAGQREPGAADTNLGGIGRTDTHKVTVALPHRRADFSLLTDAIVAKGDRPVRIKTVQGMVNACDKVWLIVRGPNVWRAQEVYVLGQKIEPTQFSVLADMDGIDINVAAMALKKDLIVAPQPQVEIVTPFGSASHPIDYKGEPVGDACKAAKVEKPADPDALEITDISPPTLDFFVPSTIKITLTGKNLGKISKAVLHDIDGVLKPLDEGKRLLVNFDATTSGIPPGEVVPVKFLDKDGKTLVTKPVRIRRSSGD